MLSPTPSLPPFPAAKTKSVCEQAADVITDCVSDEEPPPPKLPFTTRAFFEQA